MDLKGMKKMINELILRYPALAGVKESLVKAVDIMEATYRSGGKILVCGNGGSCADCEHIVGELMKGFLLKRELKAEDVELFEGMCENKNEFAKNLQLAIPAISLPSQSAVLSAFVNDVESDMMYAQLVFGYGAKNDLLIAISTSGNSKNVVNAAIAAKAKEMKIISMTGEEGGKLKMLCDVLLNAPEMETFKVQEYHLPMYHYLCAELEKRIFG